MKTKYSVLTLFLVLITTGLDAKVRMPALFSDHMVLQQNSEVPVWGWADKGKKITVVTSWDKKTYTAQVNSDGSWKVRILSPSAGGPYEMTISDGEEFKIKDIMIGEVWLCAGQSNMEMPMKGFRGQPVEGSNVDIVTSSNYWIRFISVPRNLKTVPQKDFNGNWEIAAPGSVSEFSATAYYFGSLLQKVLKVPVGLVEVSYGGSCVEAWISRENTASFNGKEVPGIADSVRIDNRTPSTLFYGMLSPVIGFPVKGVIWYQGETNYINAEYYTDRFSTMVREWRTLWGQGNFPFYYVQIAPFDYSVFHNKEEYLEKYNSAYLREAQLKALDVIPESGMAVTIDVGEKNNIHPGKKRVVGERLCFLALGKTYNVKGIGYDTPMVKGVETDGSSLVISFDNIPNGITSYGKVVDCFEIAGEDEKFYPANVDVRSKSVVLSSPDIENPVAARYAFRDFVTGQLFGVEGIPVPSFRTDNW